MMRDECDQIKSYIFFDCESTGLPSHERNVRIVEITFIAILAEHLLNHDKSRKHPRVLNKLTICFNPQKQMSFVASNINGLDNFLLNGCKPFSSNTVQLISSFIQSVPAPACLIAHNGLRFDFPLLRKEIQKTGEHFDDAILCADSLCIFRRAHELGIERLKAKEIAEALLDDTWDELICQKLDELDANPEAVERILMIQKANETTPSKKVLRLKHEEPNAIENLYYSPSRNATSRKQLNFRQPKVSFKLGDVYTRLTGKQVANSHESEADVLMMIESAIALGDEFHQIANEVAQEFSTVKVMD